MKILARMYKTGVAPCLRVYWWYAWRRSGSIRGGYTDTGPWLPAEVGAPPGSTFSATKRGQSVLPALTGLAAPARRPAPGGAALRPGLRGAWLCPRLDRPGRVGC